MSQWRQPALVLATCTLLFAQFPDALAQDNTDPSNSSQTDEDQKEDEGSVWDWFKNTFKEEQPNGQTNDTGPCVRRCGDGGEGGGHGGGDSGDSGDHG